MSRVGYLGPAGSWTHQACIDLFDEGEELVALHQDELFAAYACGAIETICVPVTTSVVGVTPYLDEVLALKDALVIAEYPKMLGYSMLARPGTRKKDIKTVVAHAVALEEVKPWLDIEMPDALRKGVPSAGAAAEEVAATDSLDIASMGPRVGASIYGLVALVEGIEEGPHNVTRWWVLGRQSPAPTEHDKTSLVADINDHELAPLLADFSSAKIRILDIYERPSKRSLDTHRYLIEVDGHAQEEILQSFIRAHPFLQFLGSYARKY
jgi:chorismate mutase / prephenate dehydratase